MSQYTDENEENIISALQALEDQDVVDVEEAVAQELRK